ncbi:IS5 family transposase [Anabaena sp. YBS01]|uniref:IS5 family transposase n=1 Tax=Anabaena sp. YBS01 TaxID=2490939 RepID=UPI0012931658|nr:IS5 family transposase [Anabaena sp. YBS01]QFZ15687.1 IS5 family transposase [Anabaena sp. YBS01]
MQVACKHGKKLAISIMLSASKKPSPQLGMFTGLADQLDQKHPLFILAHKINWSVFDTAFKIHYSEKMGKPAKPIRLMVSLLILKQVRNLSDESVVEQWSENLYYQYFGGEHHFQPGTPCVPTELVAFRQRIGEAGMELILKESIRVNEPPDDAGSAVVSVDTTVQEKNITYPTDDKQYKKIIKNCRKIAEREDINVRQSYTRTVKKLSHQQRFKHTKGGARLARKASRRIKVIAGRLLRELIRKLPLDKLGIYLPKLKLYQRVLSQKREDTDKIYSLHEPHVKCFTKGKEHKKFEFGSKASFLICQQTGIIMGALNFTATLHDAKTLPEVLEQYQRLNNKEATDVFVDRGYKGIKQYKGSRVHVPEPDKNISSKKRKQHSRRAAIEPTIGHLKRDYRLGRNYLKGILGDQINVILAAAAMNFKRVMNLWRTEAVCSWQRVYNFILYVMQFLLPIPKVTF